MTYAAALHSLVHHAAAMIFFNLSCGVLGVPGMAEALLLVEGVLSGAGGSLVAPFAAAVVGSAVGMTISFHAGHRLRRAPAGGTARRWHLSIARGEAIARRLGPWSLVVAYFTPGLRHVAAAAAGAADMSRRRFTAFAVLGASLWSALLLLMGRLTGDVRTAASTAHRLYFVAAAVAALAAIVVSTRFGALKWRDHLLRRRRSTQMQRIAIAVAAVLVCGSTVLAAAPPRPHHAAVLHAHRPRTMAAMGVHVRPFGPVRSHAAVRRSSTAHAARSARPASSAARRAVARPRAIK